jgi:2-keto-4-pentenoate hydratase
MLADLARRLWSARLEGGAIPVAVGDALGGLEDAYAVQREIAELAGMVRGGWKVGATSQAAQQLLNTPEPATAPMFEPLCYQSPAEVAIHEGRFASAESEFAFRFCHDLPARDEVYSRTEVLDAVGTLCPSIEIVSCRYEGGFQGLGGVRLISDMTANLAWTHGPETTDWRGRDLTTHRVVLKRNGAVAAEGTGAQVLGDPLNVLEWTANHLSRLGYGIAADEVITTGTCTGVTPVAAGDLLVADFGDLGSAEVRFVPAVNV